MPVFTGFFRYYFFEKYIIFLEKINPTIDFPTLAFKAIQVDGDSAATKFRFTLGIPARDFLALYGLPAFEAVPQASVLPIPLSSHPVPQSYIENGVLYVHVPLPEQDAVPEAPQDAVPEAPAPRPRQRLRISSGGRAPKEHLVKKKKKSQKMGRAPQAESKSRYPLRNKK